MRLRIISATCSITLSFFLVLSWKDSSARTKATIMSYNAHNLFDTFHDPGKEDYQYLPKSKKKADSEAYNFCMKQGIYKAGCLNLDWNDSVYDAKLRNIAQLIASFDGRGPDIIVFQEVENIKVLYDLVHRYLPFSGYQNIQLIEGPDTRGIDIGLVSRFPLAALPNLWPVNLMNTQMEEGITAKPTRGILEVPLNIGGAVVHILGNHWPSRMNPAQNREDAARVLRNVLENLASDDLVVAVGDFNVSDEELFTIIGRFLLLDTQRSFFIDAYSECRLLGGNHCLYPPGTYYYGGEKIWNGFDRIFFSNSFFKGGKGKVNFRDFTVYAPEFATLNGGKPKAFDPKRKEGYSDHFPVAMQFELN